MPKTTIFIYENKQVVMNSVTGDHISLSWSKGDFYESKLLKKIASLNLGGTYVDIGSHHGNHSIFFSLFTKCTRVISIEGNPFNYDFLKKNIVNNNCKNIESHNVIIGNDSLERSMIYNIKNTGASRVIDEEYIPTGLEYGFAKNKTNKLDDLIDSEDVSIIKIDVENFEYFVLLGAEKIIKSKKPIIILELHKNNKYHKQVVSLLNSYNYKTDGVNYAVSPTFIYHYLNE